MVISLHFTLIEDDDSAGQEPPFYIRQARFAHPGADLLGPGEGLNGVGKVAVGGGTAEQAPNGGKKDMEIESVERLHPPGARKAEFENDDLAAGADDASHLAKSFERVGEISESEGDGGEVEGGVGEGEALGVGFGEEEGARAVLDFLGGLAKHRMRKIDGANDGLRRETTAEGQSEVSGARANVENPADLDLGGAERGADGGAAPEAVDGKAEEVVENIVSGGDGGKHAADFARMGGKGIAGGNGVGRSAH